MASSEANSVPQRRARPQRLNRSKIASIVMAWMALCWLIIGSVFYSIIPGGWFSIIGLMLLSYIPLLFVARSFGGPVAPSAHLRLWGFRPFWYSQLLLPLMAMGGLVGLIIGLPFHSSGIVGRSLAGGIGLLYLAGIGLAYFGSRRLAVRELTANLPQLPNELAGLKIVQISDTHVGPHTSRRHLRNVVEAIEAAKPDLIVMTGDQVDDYVDDIKPFAAAFGKLSAPLGVVAIAGNHDVYAGWDGVRAGLEQMGIKVLVNQATAFNYRGVRWWLAGTGDPAGTYVAAGREPVAPDIAKTLAKIPANDFHVVLAHNPALWPALAERNVPLTLSGHTHYGQFAIPKLGWSMASAFLEHSMGHYQVAQSLLYINPGTNYWGIPFRLGTKPEVTVITLQPSPTAAISDSKA